jgi:hypothetical protein
VAGARKKGHTPEFLHRLLIYCDILHSNLGIRMLLSKVELGSHRREKSRERSSETRARHQKGYLSISVLVAKQKRGHTLNRVPKDHRVLQHLFTSSFDGCEFTFAVCQPWSW